MAIIALVGAVCSFLVPLGAEAEHGHDHGDAPAVHGLHAPRARATHAEHDEPT